MGQNKDVEQLEALQSFIDAGIIEEVVGVVKSGKEATVYACRGTERMGGRLFAAKAYRSRDVRRFSNDAAYMEGRWHGESRVARAMKNRSSAGRKFAFGEWVTAEFDTLVALHAAGADVPRPERHSDSVILMEYIGDEDGAAPMLAQVRLTSADAARVFAQILRNIEVALSCDRIHGDLSAYNILYHEGGIRLIDFPQAVDPRFNTGALTMLERDIANVTGHLQRFGLDVDPPLIARRLWGRFLRSEL